MDASGTAVRRARARLGEVASAVLDDQDLSLIILRHVLGDAPLTARQCSSDTDDEDFDFARVLVTARWACTAWVRNAQLWRLLCHEYFPSTRLLPDPPRGSRDLYFSTVRALRKWDNILPRAQPDEFSFLVSCSFADDYEDGGDTIKRGTMLFEHFVRGADSTDTYTSCIRFWPGWHYEFGRPIGVSFPITPDLTLLRAVQWCPLNEFLHLPDGDQRPQLSLSLTLFRNRDLKQLVLLHDEPENSDGHPQGDHHGYDAQFRYEFESAAVDDQPQFEDTRYGHISCCIGPVSDGSGNLSWRFAMDMHGHVGSGSSELYKPSDEEEAEDKLEELPYSDIFSVFGTIRESCWH